MTPFRFEHEFRGSVEGYWSAFFDRTTMRQQYERVGVRDFEVLELTDDPDRRVRSVRVVPARELPAVVRKLTGASFGYTETTTFYKQEGFADTEVTPSTLGKRVSINGRHTVEPSGPGRVIRVFSGELDIPLRLVGARIEKTILEDMSRSYAAGAEITQAWLDNHQ